MALPQVAAALEITLSHEADFAGWRAAARCLLAAQVAPERVAWQVDRHQPSLFERPLRAVDGADACRVPRHLVRLAEQAALHVDPGRFALLYRLLWRVTHGERTILLRRGDRDVARVEAMAAAVRRAAHRLRHLARFREVATGEGDWLVGWFEPEHHVLRQVVPQLATGFADRRWLLATPSEIALAEGGEPLFLPGLHRREVPTPGAGGAAWQAFLARAHPGSVTVPAPQPAARESCIVLLVATRAEAEQDPAVRGLTARALHDAGLAVNGLARTFAQEGGRRPAPRRRQLEQERRRIRPDLIVALGAPAAEALLERPVFLPLERGRIMPLEDGSRLLVTADPAAVLALPDATAQGREFRRLVADLLLAVPYQRRAA